MITLQEFYTLGIPRKRLLPETTEEQIQLHIDVAWNEVEAIFSPFKTLPIVEIPPIVKRWVAKIAAFYLKDVLGFSASEEEYKALVKSYLDVKKKLKECGERQQAPPGVVDSATSSDYLHIHVVSYPRLDTELYEP